MSTKSKFCKILQFRFDWRTQILCTVKFTYLQVLASSIFRTLMSTKFTFIYRIIDFSSSFCLNINKHCFAQFISDSVADNCPEYTFKSGTRIPIYLYSVAGRRLLVLMVLDFGSIESTIVLSSDFLPIRGIKFISIESKRFD